MTNPYVRKVEPAMTKTYALLCLLLCLLLPIGLVLAEEAAMDDVLVEAAPAPARMEARKMMTLTGKVMAGETKAVAAPFGGAIGSLSLAAGDLVAAGDTLLTLETTKVYAPCDGTVGSLGARAGDDVTAIQDRYGALLYIEPENQFLINTDTTYAYSASENYIVHVGETVYIGSRTSSGRTGTGFVTAVDGASYTVEVTGGNLVMDDSVSIFRSSAFDATTKIGSGTTERNANMAISSEGSVFKVHVAQGDAVRRGDVLLETVKGSIGYNPFPSDRVTSGYHAIVASVDAQAGSSVDKGQTLATLYPLESLQIAVDVSEADLRNVAVGDGVQVEIVSLWDDTPMAGTVAAISGLGTEGESETTYTVRIAFDATADIRVGMSANVYFNQ